MAFWARSICPNCGQKATGSSCPWCNYPLRGGRSHAKPPAEKHLKKLAERKREEARQQAVRIKQEAKKKAEQEAAAIIAQSKPKARQAVEEVTQQARGQAVRQAAAIINEARQAVEQESASIIAEATAMVEQIVEEAKRKAKADGHLKKLAERKHEEAQQQAAKIRQEAKKKAEQEAAAIIAQAKPKVQQVVGEINQQAEKKAEREAAAIINKARQAAEQESTSIIAEATTMVEQVVGEAKGEAKANGHLKKLIESKHEEAQQQAEKIRQETKNKAEQEAAAIIAQANLAVRESIRGVRQHTKKRAERETASEVGFRRVVTENADGIIIVDRSGTVLFINPAAEALFGRGSEELVSSVFGFPTVAGETTEVDIIRKGGETRVAEMRVVETEWEKEPAYLASIRDITERKHMEEALRKERERLEQQDKERLEFIGVISHELKTPLTSLIASSSLLSEELSGGPDNPQMMLVDNIENAARSMDDRLSELLSLAKMGISTLMINPSPLDIRQLLEQTVSQFNPIAQKRNQTLALEPLPSLPKVEADAQRLEQVLLNLLTNASKFSPEGGKIAVRANIQDANVLVEVEDNGPGIPKETQERVFEPYYRTEADRQQIPGLGLGLALSKRLVEEQGGRLWLNSELGKGSIFTFSLPLAGKDEEVKSRQVIL
ncbi:MAG: ATP-binding protein [Dehalococcoidia bacterium]|nr:ATP-binding protein [Dehalococcoidia bacterium]